jgi:hypothetical protein
MTSLRGIGTCPKGQRTMGLWLEASLPALILVLSFITILLRVRTFETFGA